MIYPDDFESKLAFDKIREMIRGAALCPLGAARVDAMHFMTRRDEVERQLAMLDEMLALLAHATRPFPTDHYYDLTEPLARLRLAGTYLEAGDLWHLGQTLHTVGLLLALLAPTADGDGSGSRGIEMRDATGGATSRRELPLLRSLTEGVVVPEAAVRRIDQTLTPTGEIRDNASPALAAIRRELASTVGSISRLLHSILRSAQSDGIVAADVSPTVRDGRLVIPVPPSGKHKLHGIVHDESASGKTLFIEPTEVVEANNRIRELEAEERQEIIRILTEVADTLRPSLPDLMACMDLLGEVDFLHAKAVFAQRIEAIVPQMSADGSTDWVQARHPLLYLRYARENERLIAQGASADDLHRIVPLDICMDRRDQRIILISGPNAGGKSVVLETIGLLQYMLQCGLALPLKENSRVTLYQDIMVDIGDQQSIDDDLSTYSSFLLAMKHFLRHAWRRSLLLIDELGSGTEPQIGGAIAQALLGKFNDAHANGVITTHFTNLKLYADQTPGIRNGAMLYDRAQMRPLFLLEVGRPGSSFAIEIAHKTGLPADVIDEARRIVGSDYVNLDKYLQDITRDKRYWEQKRQKIHQQEKELDEQQARLEARMAEVRQKKAEILQQARDEAASLMQQANARIERTIREIKEAQAEREATRRIRAQHEAFRSGLSSVGDEAEDGAPTGDAGAPGRQSARRGGSANGRSAGPGETTTGRTGAGGGPTPTGRRSGAQAGGGPTPTGRRSGAQAGGSPATDGPAPLAVGDHVRLRGQRTVGQVIALSGRKAQVAFGTLRSAIELDRLERVSAHEARKEERSAAPTARLDASTTEALRQRRLHFHQELDVRGLRAEEALQKVMLYLDDAIMLGVGEVRILHGTGTGALRQSIRQYLATLGDIRAFHDEHVQMGGAGITVVEL